MYTIYWHPQDKIIMDFSSSIFARWLWIGCSISFANKPASFLRLRGEEPCVCVCDYKSWGPPLLVYLAAPVGAKTPAPASSHLRQWAICRNMAPKTTTSMWRNCGNPHDARLLTSWLLSTYFYQGTFSLYLLLPRSAPSSCAHDYPFLWGGGWGILSPDPADMSKKKLRCKR